MIRLHGKCLCWLVVLLIVITGCSGVCASYSANVLQTGGYTFGEATSISDSGQIVGRLWQLEGDGGIVRWDSTGSAPSLIVSGDGGGVIGNGGDVAGDVVQNDLRYAFLSMHDGRFSYLEYEGGSVEVSGINSSGQVLGTVQAAGVSRPFIWSSATGYTWITQPVGLSANVYGMNEPGQVVGWGVAADGSSSAFLWSSPTEIIELTPDLEWSTAVALNDAGQVAGMCQLPDGGTGIFLWGADTGPSILARFDPSVMVNVFSLNDPGTIVGSITDTHDDFPISRAFALGPESGMTILGEGIAYDINNAGLIAGRSFQYGAVVWQPVPEPSSLLALAGGFGCFAVCARHRRGLRI